MSFRKFASVSAVLLAATALSAFAQITIASGPSSTTFTRTLAFGPVGLASSETASVNLWNSATASSSGAAASCTGTVAFTSASGAALGSSTTFTVTSNEISSVKVAGAGTDTREEIVATITLTQTAGTPCSLNTSFETYDTTTGVSHLHISGGQMSAGPNPIGH